MYRHTLRDTILCLCSAVLLIDYFIGLSTCLFIRLLMVIG